jgi:GDPmannose 4,6-dehydratase
MQKKALITGITGQDGSYMAEYLLNKNYEVYGFARHSSWIQDNPASHLKKQVKVYFGDMATGVDIATTISSIMPDEIYNLASQSRPSESWNRATETLLINGMGAVHLFEAVRLLSNKSKVYHASSSEMYGRTKLAPQNELTPFEPVSPYAASKVYAHQMAKIYRESYNLFIANGILFNHESERRPRHFVTQKIAYGAACAALGIINSPDNNERGEPIVQNGKLILGNLEVSRDWGYAKDFVHAMWKILQLDNPDDFVIGTGKLHTLKEFCQIAYQIVAKNWQEHVISDKNFIRPIDANLTVADTTKASKILNWSPSISFEEMIKKMVQEQINILKASKK